jgi:hypothetical protein
MPNPGTSALDAVVAHSDARLDFLVSLIVGGGLEEASLGDAYLDRRGADVLAHLHGWHGLFAAWCRDDGRGRVPTLPAPGYTWEDLRALNDEIYDRYRAMPWGRVLGITRASHFAVIELLSTYPEGSLTDPDRYPWANGSLLDLADECLGKHYDWGIARVEECLAAR